MWHSLSSNKYNALVKARKKKLTLWENFSKEAVVH